ncbi:hypothetical protein ACVI1L_000895 [Bradyrhizobium sp. USDA 4516]
MRLDPDGLHKGRTVVAAAIHRLVEFGLAVSPARYAPNGHSPGQRVTRIADAIDPAASPDDPANRKRI